MYDLFFQHFNKNVPLSAADMEIIKSYLTPKKLRKKQYLLQEGDVCKYIAFVTKGALKSYTIEANGTERIMQFAVDGWTIADLYSFLTGEPATHNIDALEDTELVLISRAAHDELLLKLDKYGIYMRLLVTGAYLALQKRFNSTVSQSLEEQYTNFITRYPEIAHRVPQHMVASYLGLTPETISRLRRKIATRR